MESEPKPPRPNTAFESRIFRLREASILEDRARTVKLQLLRSSFPVSSHLRWRTHGHNQEGHVVGHSTDERLRVRNSNTDNVLWVSLFDMIQYVEYIEELRGHGQQKIRR